ncbi:MAG: hemolysin family protein [Chitinophagales bacterium]|nr:hemolysin family protein [Chitinophagales bacterium]
MDAESGISLKLFLSLLLVFLNGFFVAAEFAIVKVRASKLESLVTKNLAQKTALKIIGNLDNYLAATQLGITLASLALGWIGESAMEALIIKVILALNLFEPSKALEIAHSIALPLGFFIITFLHIVFGELVPKSMAIVGPLKTTLLIATPLNIFQIIFSPLISFLNGIANVIIKAIGIQMKQEDVHSEEELKLIISESAEGGAIEDSERELIQNVFDFDDRLVKQVYVHNTKVSGIPVDITISEATKIVFEEGYSRYPIYNGSLDNIIGMIHAKDILKSNIQKSFTKISEIKRDVIYINESKKILEVLRLFQKEKTEFGIVVDEFGATTGIVTMEDIIEELVGDIQDEHDNEFQIVEKISESEFRIYSLNSVIDINEFIPFPIPENEQYETLSGYIAMLSDRLPVIGDEIEDANYLFRINTMNRKSPEIVTAIVKKTD